MKKNSLSIIKACVALVVITSVCLFEMNPHYLEA